MNKIKRKLALLTLTSYIASVFTGCSIEDVVAGPTEKPVDDNNIVHEEMIENNDIITSEDVIIDETEVVIPVPDDSEPTPEDDVETIKGTSYIYNTITANHWVNIRREPKTGDVLGILPEGESLSVLGYEDGWFKVIYNGEEAYVSGEYASVSENQTINIPSELEDNIYEYDTITALANVNIRTAPVDGEILGTLPYGKKLTLLDEVDGWYKVLYYGKEAYVSGDYATTSTSYSIDGDISKIMYATDELTIYIPYEINNNGEVALINELECLEVYGETDDLYLVKTSDYVGYVKKNSLKELCGTFVVVDISDQNLKLYVDNEVVVDTPVVTGKKSTPSDIGLFDIDGIDHHRYLRGPGYASWVDIFMYYNGGEGLHDAEYHSCDAKKNHGWRTKNEFGGETYINNGSHGCVNMLHDDVMEVSEYVEVGTLVLVKK